MEMLRHFIGLPKAIQKTLYCAYWACSHGGEPENFILALGKEPDKCRSIIALNLESAKKLRDALTDWIDAMEVLNKED